jgi:8-oxo-dGTP pyrophosphatase MutT (NUDIX family)
MSLRRVLDHAAAAAVPLRQAATTLVLRDGPAGLEVLMVRRSLQASFMPGAHVFPGGAVDPTDGNAAAEAVCDEPRASVDRRIGEVTGVGHAALGFAVAALRECFEECGLWLGAPSPAAGAPGGAGLRARLHAGEPLAALAAEAGLGLYTRALQPWAHWVTPYGVAKRFDTLFFVVAMPDGQLPTVDEAETTALEWVRPGPALEACAAGGFPMEFATRTLVESLRPFGERTVAEVLAHAAAQPRLPAVHPRLRIGDGGAVQGVLLPGDSDYERVGYVPRRDCA